MWWIVALTSVALLVLLDAVIRAWLRAPQPALPESAAADPADIRVVRRKLVMWGVIALIVVSLALWLQLRAYGYL